MLNARLRLNKTELRILAISLMLQPAMAFADWKQTINQYAGDIQLALYGIAGTIAVISLVWSGVKWQFARMSGDRSHTFMDYVQEVLVIIAVSASVILATAAWQIFGSSGGGGGGAIMV